MGFLFLILYPGFFPASPPHPASRRLRFTHIFHTPSLSTIFVNHHLSHTISHTPSLTHLFVNHHLSHTIFQPPAFTYHLSHTSLSTTIFHTPSFTHHLYTHHPTPSLSTIIFHTPSFTHHLSHTISHTHTHIFVNHHWWRAWAGISRR